MTEVQANNPAPQKRRFEGTVVSDGAQKTISVKVDTHKMHPKYKKQYVVSRKFPVHDEQGQAKLGDVVLFEECRPMSKTKRWRLIQVVKSAA
ncbi:30S ribosomal protein S17 [Candidatus Nomurabacteria bacterium]|nr:30S ribosomal protein S17 [Candidatus Nomurabacteria bacterium]